jgi:predicted glycoside hydrolase/deacetylase ChbG (UPF0249 family)
MVELYRAGVLTSTTLMARATAAEDAISLARENPGLKVGCHVVLADGVPVLPQREIPSLTDRRTGRFPPTAGAFLRRLLAGRIRGEEMEAEAAAQIASLRARGVALTHIDTHKHLHVFPPVLRAVLRAARANGISALRNPFEAQWSLRATRGADRVRRVQLRALGSLQPAFRRIVAEAGLITTDGAIAVLATGRLDAATLGRLLAKMPEGTWELVTHPGYNDADLARARTRLLASRDAERLALLSLQARDDFEWIDFGRL